MSNEAFRGLIDCIPDGVVVADRHGRVQFANAAAQAFLASQRERLADDSLGLVLRPGTSEHYFQHGNGTPRVAQVRVIESEWNGEPAWVATLRDVSSQRRTQQEIEAFLEHAPALVHIKDAAGRYTLANRRFASSTRLPHGEIAGKTDHELFAAEVADHSREMDRRVVESGESVTFQQQVDQSDGPHAYLSHRFPLRDVQGRIYAIAGIQVDVTESKGIESELRLKSAALNAAAHAIVITDREGRISWVNEAVTSLTGFGPQELLGQNPRIFKSGQHNDDFFRELWETVIAGRPWRGEVTNRRKDGSLYIAEVNITPVRDLQGVITHFIAIKQDITARRRGELELRRSQELNRQLVESVPAGIVLFSDSGKVMSGNSEAERLLGLSFSELCKQGLSDWAAMAIQENGRPLGSRGHPLANCLRSRRPQAPVTLGLQRPGGGIRWVVCTAAPVPACGREDSSGAVLALVDITERKLAEHGLRESEARQRAILQSSLDCVVVMDTGEQILEFNPAAERTFGYQRGEVIGHPMPELLIAPSSRESFRQGLKHCLRTGSRRVFEKRVEITAMRKGEAEFPIETALSVAYHHGKPIFTAVLHDITERKAAQEKLIRQTEDLKDALDAVRRVQERERQVLASIPSIFIGIDDHGTVTHWNPAAERQFSLPAGEVIGRPLGELAIGWRSERVRQAIESCSRSGRPTHLDNLSVSAPDGPDRVLTLTINRIETQDNEDLGVVVVGVDVTEPKAMESQLMLAQKMESIGQLAAGIAHEINTPTQYVSDNTRFLRDSFQTLKPLLSLCEALSDAAPQGPIPAQLAAELGDALEKADLPFLTKEIPQALDQSLEGLSRVSEIVKAMKQFSHPDQDEPELADLNQAIGNTATVARNEWKYVAEMELDLEPGLPSVPCQLGRFNQVVLNLIVNAAQAIAGTISEGSQERGKIRISTREGDGHVEIRITDTGPGIPPEIRNKIFDPFFTTKEVGKGTGQGLAITHNIIVEKHGGTIDVESEPGKGATFILRLPLQTEPVATGDDA